MIIACICTGNTCRSPMLAALLERELAQRGLDADHQVVSAGVAARGGEPANGFAVTCLAEHGIDLGRHVSRNVLDLDLAAIGLFLCMGSNHGHALLELGVDRERIMVVRGEAGGVPDPFGSDLATYRATGAVLTEVAREVARTLQERSDG